MKCVYECNRDAKYILNNGKYCCSITFQSCPAIKCKNSIGLRNAYKNGKRKVRGNFTKDDRIKSNLSKINNIKKLPFELWGARLRRKQIELEQDNKCLICNLDTWLKNKLTLQLDHIDGNNQNNTRENLRLLCPNCHSQTETYCGKNINSGLIKVTDEDLLIAYKNTQNISQALKMVGLAPKGGNYKRMYKIIDQYTSVAEVVYAADLKSAIHCGCAGSSPVGGTI